MSYSVKYLDHFSHPRGIGEVEPPDAEARVKHEGGGCFDDVRLTLRLADGVIKEARFRARACSGTIAACSALCEMISGLGIEEAARVTAEDIANHLEGIPDAKRHSVELAAKSLIKALEPLPKSLNRNSNPADQ